MKLRKKAQEELRKLKVGVVYLIGSRASGGHGPTSDIDIAVVFLDGEATTNKSEVHPVLYNLLTEPFPVSTTQDLDIVYLQETSLSFQFVAISSGRILYECGAEFRADYEEAVVKEYLDFAPLENVFSEALMERLS